MNSSAKCFYNLRPKVRDAKTLFAVLTLCPVNLDPFYIFNYYINWDKTRWTDK